MNKENPQLILGDKFFKRSEELLRKLCMGEINEEQFDTQLWSLLDEPEFIEQLQNWDRNPFK